MAIQVSGITVIDNARELENITAIDATTAASITAAGVGAGGAPTPPNWLSPTATVSSTGTWSKPGSIGNDDWVIFYLVGGGGGWGEYNSGGGGASGVVVAMKGSIIPSSVAMTIGAGAPAISKSVGGDTTMTISGFVLRAAGGVTVVSAGTVAYPPAGVFSVPSDGTQIGVALGSGTSATGGPALWSNGSDNPAIAAQGVSIFGGGSGGGTAFSSNVAAPGGASSYAGSGGNGGNLTPTSGGVPGGGAGGSAYPLSTPTTTGGAGNVRIYY